MRNKVVYIVLLIILSAPVLDAQKPTFALIPTGKYQKIPDAVIDMKYYNGKVCTTDCYEDSLIVHKENDAEIDHKHRDVRRDSSKYSGAEDLSGYNSTGIFDLRFFMLIKLIPLNYIISLNIF